MKQEITPERWQQIERLYHSALEYDSSQRRAFLQQACAGDDALREEVESLLARGQTTDGLLDHSALGEIAAQMLAQQDGRSLLGTKLGSYQVLTLLGCGGMGEVYQAHDNKLRRDVAIKVLPAAFMHDAERLARFEREARMLAALNHPNIATIYGLEHSDGVHYLVMELVPGQTLAERVSAGPLPIKEALAVAGQIAEALEAAHEKGVIHRDLKPANVKVTPQGKVKVLDFGLAKAFAGHSELDLAKDLTLTAMGTEDGRILGTPAYMSPEQARGKPVDKRTDIWAFGCLLYELLTARQAFRGDTLTDILAAVLEREPNWEVLPPVLPRQIRTLLIRCSQKDPQRRLHDIADARLELDDALSRREIDQIFTPTLSERKVIRWQISVAVACGLAAGAVLLAIALKIRQTAPSVPQWSMAQTVATQLTSYGGTETAPALSPDGKSFAFVSGHAGMPDIWLRQVSGGEPVQLTKDAAEKTDLAYSPDGETIYYTRIDESGSSIWSIGALGGQAHKVVNDAERAVPSPDGQNLAYYELEPGGSFALSISTLDGSAKKTVVRGLSGNGGGLIRAAWSPNGHEVSYRRSGLFTPSNLFIVDVGNGHEQQVTHFTRSNEGVFEQVWLPDNRHLAVSYVPSLRLLAPKELGILDIQDGSIMRMTMAVGDSLSVQNISADGSRLIATALQRRNEVWKVPFGPDPEANGRAAIRLLDSTWAPLWTFVSRDGRTLLFNSPASGSRNLWTMTLDGKSKPRQITAIGGDVVAHCSLSPDGSQIAFTSNATGDSQIWAQNVDGSDLRQLTNDGNADSWPVWSPDGRWIVFASDVPRGGREIRRVLATGGPEEKISDGSFRGDWFPQPNGTGTWLTSITGSGGVRLLDMEHQILLWERKKPFGNALPMFSPDGKLISAFAADNVIWVFETATGKSRLAAKLPFPATFRADWTDNGRAFVVNREDSVSHIVLFDRFWVSNQARVR